MSLRVFVCECMYVSVVVVGCFVRDVRSAGQRLSTTIIDPEKKTTAKQ